MAHPAESDLIDYNFTPDSRDLLDLYREHDGKISDKWLSYLEIYEQLFGRFRDRPVRILEIGIQNGGSLDIWSRYFRNAEQIVGCDIDPRCDALIYDDPRISVVIGDSNSPDTFAHIMARSAYYDIIIDDGSHRSSDIIRSFALYFPRLVEDGLFVAEDLHCSYWSEFDGGIEAPYSAMSFFKRLADFVNREHWGVPVPSETMLSFFARFFETSFDSSSLDLIDEVRFRNSVCVVSKGKAGTNLLGQRVIAGSTALVENAIDGLDGMMHHRSDQSLNGYGPTTPRLEEAIAARDEAWLSIADLAVARREAAVAQKAAAVAEQEAAVARQELLEVQQKLRVMTARVAECEMRLDTANRLLPAHIDRAEALQRDLVMARRRPHKLLGRLLVYCTLRTLAKASPPLPRRVTARFGRSAAKRNPGRITPLAANASRGDILPPGATGCPVPVLEAQQRLLADAAARFAGKDRIPGSITGDITFSILLPVYNTPPELLRRCLDTVLGQTYAKWELQVVNDASRSAEIEPILHAYAARDSRVRSQHLHENRGIAVTTQAALEAATGTYICLLDHDDELACNALERIATVIAKRPEVGVIYSDECKISPDGIPTEVFAKPDWSPAMLINCMYIGHLTTYRRDLVFQAGGFRSEFDFSQDYDLALRVTERDVEVHHIPEVLYGWRAVPQSAAAGGKSFARETNVAALQSAADRRNWHARAIAKPFANILEWDHGGDRPLVSLVLPSDNGRMIKEAIRSILDTSTYPHFEILVVTNSCLITELSAQNWSAQVQFVPFDSAFNFSEKCNLGASAASGDILIFYNDDVRVQTPEWMERLIEIFRIDGVGAVGPKLLYETGMIQHAGMVTGVRRLVGTAFHTLPADTSAHYNFAQSLREVSLLCGALLAVRTSSFLNVGGFDAERVPVYHSDVDLCFKIREAGQRCLYTPHVNLLHIGHVSIGAEEKKTKKIKPDKAGVYLLKRWAREVASDPYFPVPMRDLCYHDSPEPFAVHPGSRIDGSVTGDALLISHDLSGSGAPRVLLEIARALQREGWFVVVASPTDGSTRAEFEALGITVVIDSLLLQRHESVRDFAKDYDLVIANTIVTWPLVAQLRGIVPVAWYVHEIDLVDQLASAKPEFLPTLAAAETVWAGSNLCAENLRRYRETVTVFEYGVDLARPLARRARGGSIRLAVFASFEPRKGQDLLAEAFAALTSAERDGVSLHFFGRVLHPDLRDEVIARFGNVPGIHFKGELPHDAYMAEMGAFDMVVIPSRSDTLPLVSLNALGAGVPLMCTCQTGTAAYLEDGVSGYIISSASVTDMVTTLRHALAERGRWAAIGAAGQKVFAAHFSQEAFQSRLAEQALVLSGKEGRKVAAE